MQAAHIEPNRTRSWWPLLIALPPLAAVLGGIATIYLATRHPDQTVLVAPVTKAHVTNSVVPPLR